MAKIFFRTVLNIGLWLILAANLIIVFNIDTPFAQTLNQPNTYIGTSSLIEWFESLDNFNFSSGIFAVAKWAFNYAKNDLVANIQSYIAQIQNVPSSLNIDDVEWYDKLFYVLKGIWNIIKIFGVGLYAIIIVIFGLVMYIFAYLATIIEFFFMLMMFLVGGFKHALPKDWYNMDNVRDIIAIIPL